MRPELEGKPSMGSSSKFFAEVIKLWDVFSIQCGLANGNQFNILARVTIALCLKLIGTSKLRNRDPIGTQLFMK